MILFCKDTRKVSFFQVFINQRLDVKITAENDTMTLLFGKTLLSPTGHYGLHGHIVSWRVLTITTVLRGYIVSRREVSASVENNENPRYKSVCCILCRGLCIPFFRLSSFELPVNLPCEQGTVDDADARAEDARQSETFLSGLLLRLEHRVP